MVLEVVLILVVFLVGIFIAYRIGFKGGSFIRDKYWEGEIPNHRRDAVVRSKSVLTGHFSEQLAPYLPEFKFNPNDCKFLGKPIDFIVFKENIPGEISEVVFVEVKSGKSKLSSKEKKLKEVIEKGKVRWEEYRVSEDFFKKKNNDSEN
tara:strand:+ start:21 stop:467 length:447 start_codon:yes stop_codon:yes gene_type:complete